MDERREKDVAVLMLRGALGAVAGSAVFSLPFFNPYYLLVAIYSLPFTAFIGASVGVAIWWVHGRNKEEMGPVARAAIGAFVFILAEGCIALLSLLVERPFSSTSGSVVKVRRIRDRHWDSRRRDGGNHHGNSNQLRTRICLSESGKLIRAS